MSGPSPTTIRSSLNRLLSGSRHPARFLTRHLTLWALAACFAALLLTHDLARWPFLTLTLLGAAFLSYALAARRYQDTASPALILGVAAALRLLLIPLPPSLSDDTLRYVWDGKVLAAGHNPYLHAPEAPELAALRDPVWERMPHKEVPTVYPPLALAVFTVAGFLPHPLIGVKILLTFAELLGCFLLTRLAVSLGKPAGRAIWYCWSPLAVLEVAGMGHVDGLLMAGMVAAVGYLVSQKPSRAGLAAAAGVLAKLVPLALLPLWTGFADRRARFLAIALLTVAVATFPVVLAIGGMPPGLVKYGISWEFNGPLYEPLWRGFDQISLDHTVKAGLDAAKAWTGHHELLNRLYPFVYPQLLAKATLLALFGVFFLRIFLGFWTPSGEDPKKRVVTQTGRLLGGVVLCSATFYPWYLLWLLPWAALARHPAWLTLSALLPLVYLPQLTGWPLFPWIFLLVWGPFFALLSRSSWSID